MSKQTDIKYRIDQMDGGEFQNLCDGYLTCRGYTAQYALGMKAGTNKTAKGNPDTYFIDADGKYIFAMYTTQKDDFVNKALADLEKCFDTSKTRLAPEMLKEIVYCYTYGRLLAGEAQRLRAYCEERNTQLTLIGVDEIASDLYEKYPQLAKDFFGITVDTGQILTLQEFVRQCDANAMSAPLSTDFSFREEELKSAKDKLHRNNVLVLTGPAGVGKTRLALEICRELSNETRITVLCVKNNGVEIYDDLIAAIESGKEYLVLVDDANELTELDLILSFITGGTFGNRIIKKLILTVREYAKKQVVQSVFSVAQPEILKIGLLKDSQIKQLVEKKYGIQNYRFLDRIALIADGNARLAMLAGKVAAEQDSLEAIQDATELYEHYYGRQLDLIANSATWILSAGIMAFFHVLRLDALDRLYPVFQLADLTKEQFIADVHQLSQLELVDLCHDTAARMADQSFSNYLLKYIFVDTKRISLSQMVESCFFINKVKTIEACTILLNIFTEEKSQKYVEEQIESVWNRLWPDVDKFIPFFRAFFPVKPTDTLVLLKNLIDAKEQRDFDMRAISLSRTKNEKDIDDDIIGILCAFTLKEQFSTAVELLLCYYQKQPDLFEQVYTAFVREFGVNKDSKSFDYYTQKTAVTCLCNALEETPTEAMQLLFVCVAEEFLKFQFSKIESGQRNTFSWYTLSLDACNSVLTYRNTLLTHLCKLYKCGYCCKEIEHFLSEYGNDCHNSEGYTIVRAEMDTVLSFLAFLDPENLYHCIIVEKIKKISERAEYDCGDRLTLFLESKKYRLFHMLYSNRGEHLEMDYDVYRAWYKKCIYTQVTSYSLKDYLFLFHVCKEAMALPNFNNWYLTTGIEFAVDACFERTELYLSVIGAYLKLDTPCDISADGILENLFRLMPEKHVKEFINRHSFSQKNTWLWSFYTQMPDERVSSDWFEDFLIYLEHVPENLRSPCERPLVKIEKYEKVDKAALIKASRIISAHYNDSPKVFGLYFSFILTPYYMQEDAVIEKYKDDIALLEDIYLKCLAFCSDDDHDGAFLAKLFCVDSNFLYRYLDVILDHAGSSFYAYNPWVNRLSFIWSSESFKSYPELISDYLFERTNDKKWIYSMVISQLLLHRREDSAKIVERQDAWILHTIELYAMDSTRMHYFFGAISESSTDRRKKALERLLKLNDDYAVFEILPLESPRIGGSGSMIPYIQARIDYLSSLKPLLTGMKFLKHRQRIEQSIASWKEQIKHEEIRELLNSLG